MALRGSFGWECGKIAKELTRRRVPTKRGAWCRTACLWLAGVGISVVSLLQPILNKPQTEDLGKRPVDDGFYPHLPFIGRTPQKSMTPPMHLWLGVQEDCQHSRPNPLFPGLRRALPCNINDNYYSLRPPADVDQTCQLTTIYQ